MKMGKRWLCFLAFCAALCVPVLASEVGPYTIHGVRDGDKFTVSFSAVRVGEATVTIFDPFGGPDGEPLGKETVTVTLLTPAPGCKTAIPQSAEFFQDEPCVSVLSTNGNLWSGFMFPEGHASARHVKMVPGRTDDWEPNRGIFIFTDTGAYLILTNPETPHYDGYAPLVIEGHSLVDESGGLSYALAFESVKTETKTVMLRGMWDDEEGFDGTGYSEYESEQVTLVTVRPGSRGSLFGNNTGTEFGGLYVESGNADGNNRYTFWEGGALDGLSYDVLPRQEAGLNFANVYESARKCWIPLRSTGNQRYLIRLDTASSFEDVSASAYYACPALWAVSEGVTNGVTADTFAPNNTCTRAQILTFIWRYSGSPEPTISNPFKDVSPDNYYYKPALWACEQGMMTGREFQASTLCTRAAAVQYLWILAGRPSVGEGRTFSDVSPGAEYTQAVSYAAERGITAGTSETEFSPDNTCTRAQIVTFLYRYHAFKD
ncbi:MAG: S-layer homology domain-containing protein [Oscillibacter sp.]|nr:S-layer homology domain-containing protein [Oscillibacter sp.]